MELIDHLKELISQGKELRPHGGNMFKGYNDQRQPDYVAWRLQAITAIQELGPSSKPILASIESDKKSAYFYESSASNILGALKGAVAIAERQARVIPTLPLAAASTSTHMFETSDNQVFVVHGHNTALLQETARFLEKLNVKPIILFEQPGKSRTIIEKLEEHSDVTFAVVLLTPDDSGKAAKDTGKPKPRARQNVVLELGFFLGKLDRPNVAALYDESVELPSDYRGVEYIKIDVDGAWKMKLARELKAAGISIDMNRAI